MSDGRPTPGRPASPLNPARKRAQGELLPQERLFALEYLANGGNGTKAAEAAGYSPKAAKVQATKLLQRRRVQLFLAEKGAAAVEAVERRVEGLELSASRVLTETMRIAYADVRKLFRADGTLKRPDEWDADAAAAVASYEVTEHGPKVRLWDKPKALEMLGKHLKLWTEVVEQRVDNLTIESRARRAADLIAAALTRRLGPERAANAEVTT